MSYLFHMTLHAIWWFTAAECVLMYTAYLMRPSQWQDICKPDAARLRRNLSAVINFAKFREEKLGRFMEMQEAAEALLERNAGLEQQKRSLARHPCTFFYVLHMHGNACGNRHKETSHTISSGR